MYDESATSKTSPYESLGAGSGYELTQEEKMALPPTVRVLLAIASEAMRQSFTDPKDITRTLMELTQLDHETLVEHNKKLRHDELTEPLVEPDNPTEIRLLLTKKGTQFLADHLA